MTTIRLSECEISDIKGKLNKSINDETESNDIADYAVTLVLDCVNQHIINEHLLTLDECADTMQNLLDMINDDKYRPLIHFLGQIGGD